MKRKEAIATIEEVAKLTYRVDGVMTLTNTDTGDVYDIDMQTQFAGIRVALAWCQNLLETDEHADDAATDHLAAILRATGLEVAHLIEDAEE